jgi:hypothetical protein
MDFIKGFNRNQLQMISFDEFVKQESFKLDDKLTKVLTACSTYNRCEIELIIQYKPYDYGFVYENRYAVYVMSFNTKFTQKQVKLYPGANGIGISYNINKSMWFTVNRCLIQTKL